MGSVSRLAMMRAGMSGIRIKLAQATHSFHAIQPVAGVEVVIIRLCDVGRPAIEPVSNLGNLMARVAPMQAASP